RQNAPIPPTALNSSTVNEVTARMRAPGPAGKPRYAEGTVYQTLSAAIDMWRWVADDPEKYPEVPRPPFNLHRVLPRPPVYEAPEAAPTWAETDACLRRIRLPFPRRMATIMRYTGLRLEQ